MKLIPKKLQHFPNIEEHNWLIHLFITNFLTEVSTKYVSGSMLDLGCGLKPYEKIFSPYVSQYVGVDLSDSPHGNLNIDISGSAYDTTLESSSYNVVLCTEVLEHLEEPVFAVREINRILKYEGIVIMTIPFFWHIHEEPRDFFRYSEYGLRHIFEQTGFEIIEIRPLTGYVATFFQLSIYFLKSFQCGYILGTARRLLNWGLQHLALRLNRYDRSWNFTNLYGLVARKIAEV